MNLLGISFGLTRNWNNNGKYVKKEDCLLAQRAIKDSIVSLEKHIDMRFSDLKTLILNQ